MDFCIFLSCSYSCMPEEKLWFGCVQIYDEHLNYFNLTIKFGWFKTIMLLQNIWKFVNYNTLPDLQTQQQPHKSKDTINRLFSWQHLGLKKDLDHSDSLVAVRSGSSSVGRVVQLGKVLQVAACPVPGSQGLQAPACLGWQGSRFTCSDPGALRCSLETESG